MTWNHGQAVMNLVVAVLTEQDAPFQLLAYRPPTPTVVSSQLKAFHVLVEMMEAKSAQ
ncbi:MAG TPA: hypothetical protein VFN99_07720 [Gaiella sp.]|nr:hypothetical protein [Gaiella sp.]